MFQFPDKSNRQPSSASEANLSTVCESVPIAAEETMGIPIVSSAGHPAGKAGHICIGSKVQSDRAFKAKVGIVREIKDRTAMVEFGDGIPLYPCAIASLRVVS